MLLLLFYVQTTFYNSIGTPESLQFLLGYSSVINNVHTRAFYMRLSHKQHIKNAKQ